MKIEMTFRRLPRACSSSKGGMRMHNGKRTPVLERVLHCLRSYCLLFIAAPSMVFAQTYYTVSGTGDGTSTTKTGSGTSGSPYSIASVRGALLDIENNSFSSSIINLPSGTITLGSDLAVAPNGGRTIQFIGNGGGTTISGNNLYHVFNIDYSATGGTYVTVTNLTLTHGHDANDAYGGGAILGGTALTTPLDSIALTNCTFTNNTSTYGFGGAAIGWYGGALRMTNCTISNNTTTISGNGADGGAVFFEGVGAVSITGCTFSNNSASSSTSTNGGALYISSTTCSITNTAFSSNSATSTGSQDANGGAYACVPTTATITRCSFLNNSVTNTSTGSGYGGAIYSAGSSTATVSYSRFSGNTAKTSGNVAHVLGGSFTANNNWWGINSGPGGSDLSSGSGATVTASTYLKLRLVPARSTISAGDTTLLTADILLLSSGGTTASSNLSGLPTFTSSFGSAVLGSLSSTSNFVNGIATAKYTSSGTAGTGSAQVTADNQTTTVSPTIAIVAAPVPTTNAATSITTTTATLNGTVNANNASTTVTFEYGLTTSYGSTVTAAQSPVTGTSNTSVSYALSGLTPNTAYHFRVDAASSAGSVNGLDQSLTTSAAAPTVTTSAATSIGSSSATLNGTVNANNSATTTRFVYDTVSGSYTDSISATPSSATGTSNTGISATISSLVPNKTYYFRAVGTNSGGYIRGSELSFATTASAPSATTNAASSITTTGATLNGTVNANNQSTKVTFNYGVTASYGSTDTATQSPVTGFNNTSVSKAETGLLPNTTYHYRVVGVNTTGTTNGSDQTFTTSSAAPAVATNAASSITTTGATFNGTVNANNQSTTVTFNYGLTTSYGSTDTATQSPVTGSGNTPVSKAETGLLPNTSYHYRVTGVNTTGTTNGSDQTFTTSAAAPTVTTIAASGITTTAATLNGTVNANSQSTTVTFDYGLTASYGTSVTAVESPVTGTSNTSVSKGLTGLTPNTTYHYRVVGVNTTGTTDGLDQTFATSNGLAFTDGSSFTPPFANPNSTNNPVGRFLLAPNGSGATLSSVTVTFSGSPSGVSGVKLWSSSDNTFDSTSDSQVGTTQSYGATTTFSGLSSTISASGTYYFVTFDLGSSGGSVTATIASGAAITLTSGTLTTTINNAALSSGAVLLRNDITFTDGKSFAPPYANPCTTNNPVGRFKLTSLVSGASLSSITVTLSGTASGVSAAGVKLWSSTDNSFDSLSDVQIGSDQPYGATATFNSLSSSISTGGTYYFVTLNLGSSSGSVLATIANAPAVTISSGTLTTSISNDSLSSVPVLLRNDVTFNDGSGYTPPPISPNTNNNPVGEFKLTSLVSGASLSAAGISFSGAVSGITRVKLWSSTDATFDSASDLQLGSGSYGSLVSFNSLSSAVAPAGSYYFVTIDVGTASGALNVSLANNSALAFSQGTLVASINNAPLSGSVPLPVELSSFTVESQRLNAELKWETKTEVNTYGFDVERMQAASSSQGNNASGSYTKVGFVPGSGNSNAPKDYAFTDKTTAAGKFTYRLRQIDRDGKFSYSQGVDVEVGAAPKVFELSQNYPNPFNPATTIEFTVPSDGRATLTVYNVLGQEVQTVFNGAAKAGEYHQAVFNAGGLASGIYFARLSFEAKQQMKKMLLVK